MTNELFIEKAYINGDFITSNDSFAVVNPATGQNIGIVPNLQVADCKQAITAAHLALNAWKETSIGERCNKMRSLYHLILQHKESLAEIMTLESGKPITESMGEIDYAASFVEWFAEEGKRSYGETIPSLHGDKRLMTIKQPVGVVAAITPWNFPLAMLTRKMAPALVAGCTMLVKPASQTPFTAIALAKLTAIAGIPKGVFSVITSKESKTIGELLATSPIIQKITFTGSTQVGRTLMQQAANTIKRVSFELGGNAPFIVFNDADLDKAVQGAIAAKFRNAGQTCVSVNRFYIQDAVYEEFASKLAAAVKNLKVGDGLSQAVQVGPLINANAVLKVQSHIKDAVDKGATILTGGQALSGNFFEPTVVRDLSKNSLIAKEETFGPLCALFRFETEAEVIELANDTEYGLAAYFYSENIHRCHRIGEALEAGMVGINTGLISNASAPFGGIKQSGIGREGAKYGLEEYLNIKYLCYGD